MRVPSRDLVALNRPISSQPENVPKFYAIQNAGAASWVYRRCDGKRFWRPNIPKSIAPAGKRLSISVCSLTPKFWVENLGRIVLRNDLKIRRAPAMVQISLERYDDSGVTLRIRQESAGIRQTWDIGAFPRKLESSNGIPRLLVYVQDSFGRKKGLAFYHDGSSRPILRVKDGRQFRTAKFVFSDGVRLIIAYGKFRGVNLWTCYLKSPSELYSIVRESSPPTIDQRRPESPQKFRVEMLRPLERRMLYEGTAYEHGRLGAEIAHSISTKFLGLKNPVIGEPSSGGKDLWTQDYGFTVQARLIADFRQFHPLTRAEAISQQLGLLAQKVGQDFANSPKTHTGFIIFSYLDEERTLRSLVLKKARRSHESLRYLD